MITNFISSLQLCRIVVIIIREIFKLKFLHSLGQWTF